MIETLALILPFLLPAVIVWLAVRASIIRSKQQTELLLKSMELGYDVDIEKILSHGRKRYRNKKMTVLTFLLLGIALTLGGGSWIVGAFMTDTNPGKGMIVTAFGIAFLVAHFVGKKLFAKEIEAEDIAASRYIENGTLPSEHSDVE